MVFKTLHLSLKAQKLPNVAGMMKGTSDPFAVLTLSTQNRDVPPVKIGRTEVVKNNLSPDWIKIFQIDYDPDIPLMVNVKVFDENKGDNEEMASATFDLATVLGAKGNAKSKELKRGGAIQLRAEEARGSGSLKLQLSGIQLKNTEGFMKLSDPFYQFERKDYGLRGSEWNVVHRSVAIMDNLNPKWKEEEINLSILCRGELEEKLRFSVMDYEKSGDHVLMGQVEMSVNDFIDSFKAGKHFDLLKKGKDSSRGRIVIGVASIEGAF